MNFNGEVALVDIGWYGNMQSALTQIADANIKGYYFGLRNNKKMDIKSKGYLFDVEYNQNYDCQELYFNSIFEFIFSATHGSVKKFIESEELVEFYENENSDEFMLYALNSIQNGAKKFVEEYSKTNISNYIELSPEIGCINIFEFLNKPSYLDALNFGNIKFKDGDVNYIAKSLGIKKYLFSPKKFIKDFKSSLWKIGFLKATFKIKFPYSKFCLMLRKIKNI